MEDQALASAPAGVSRVVRSIGTVRAALGGSAFTVGFIVLALVSTNGRVAAAVLAAMMLLLTWRFWIAGIHVEKDGVRVVGILVSKRFAWESIDHFAVAPFAGYQYVGHIVLCGGRDIGCLGISAATRPNGERRRLEVQRPIDELNAALAAWHHSVGRPTPQ